jgi:hypothetical protein
MQPCCLVIKPAFTTKQIPQPPDHMLFLQWLCGEDNPLALGIEFTLASILHLWSYSSQQYEMSNRRVNHLAFAIFHLKTRVSLLQWSFLQA